MRLGEHVVYVHLHGTWQAWFSGCARSYALDKARELLAKPGVQFEATRVELRGKTVREFWRAGSESRDSVASESHR